MFGLGRSKNESFSNKSESPIVAELRSQANEAHAAFIDARDYLLELRRTESEDSPIVIDAVEVLVNKLEAYAQLISSLRTELAKTPGQQLSDTLVRESEGLHEKTDRAIDLLKTVGPRNPEFIELQAEILEMVKEVDFLKELDAKLNNRQVDKAA